MYLGYILMFLDGLSIISAIFNFLTYLRYGNGSDPFLAYSGKGTIFCGWFFDIMRKICEFSQGYLMVRATKLVIKQISVHEFNPNMEIIKYAKSVLEYEKKILILIFANIIVGAITGFYWYTVYDKYLENTFKEDYTEFKNL